MSSDESLDEASDNGLPYGHEGQQYSWETGSSDSGDGCSGDTEEVQSPQQALDKAPSRYNSIADQFLDEVFIQAVHELTTVCEGYVKQVLYTSPDTYVSPNVATRDLKALEELLQKIFEFAPKRTH